MHKILKYILILSALCNAVSHAEDLYKESSYHSLTSDRKAYRVGDILTVLVFENSSASATAGSNADKSDNTGVKFVSPSSQKNYGLNINDTFDGNGKIARTGKLLAQISVSVISIQPSGDLNIKGEQLIEINGEKQAINIEGRVRSRDIDEMNTVVSNKIANSKITYVGEGILAETQHKGWLSRIVSILGLL